MIDDLISRQAAIDAAECIVEHHSITPYKTMAAAMDHLKRILNGMPSAQPEEVIPHRNYKYLSDYWCECGWNLGKKGEVKYCSNCGRKVNWDG